MHHRHAGFQSVWSQHQSRSKAANQAEAAGGERSSLLGTRFASTNALILLFCFEEVPVSGDLRVGGGGADEEDLGSLGDGLRLDRQSH